MTTRFTIQSPYGNHLAVCVQPINPADGRPSGTPRHLEDGDKAELYVHNTAGFVVTEVPRATRTVPPQSFGQRAVGLSFNPSGDANVASCKDEFAATIDRMNNLRIGTTDPEVKRMASLAITAAQEAQMWAVKALTWRG